MIPRRPLAFVLVAAAALGLRLALVPPAPAAHEPVTAAGVGLRLVGDAFRPIVSDALFARMIAHHDANEFEEMLPLAEALLALDPAFERGWFVTAWTLGVDIPGFEEDPDVLWRWRRQGLLTLREGGRRNPRSWFLAFHEALYLDLQVARDARLVARFRADPDLAPEGLHPDEHALRRLLDAQAIPGHARVVDLAVDRVRQRLGR